MCGCAGDDLRQRMILADDARAKVLLQLQHGLDLVLHHLADRDTRPAGDDFADDLGIDADPHQRRFALQLVQFGVQLRRVRLRRPSTSAVPARAELRPERAPAAAALAAGARGRALRSCPEFRES